MNDTLFPVAALIIPLVVAIVFHEVAHGFACGLKRRYFSVDTGNRRSMAACAKIGAEFEGVLRNHMIIWTGYERDREELGPCEY